jgi:hypothetical protein
MYLETVTAAEMARAAGINPKRFRGELRKTNFAWHHHNERWTVLRDSPEHNEMRRVLSTITGRTSDG